MCKNTGSSGGGGSTTTTGGGWSPPPSKTSPAKKASQPSTCPPSNVAPVAGGTATRNAAGCITGYEVGLLVLII